MPSNEYKEVKLDTTLTENLCLEGLKAEIERIIAQAKKKAEVNPDKLEVSLLIAISYKDLSKYTKKENVLRRKCSKNQNNI